MFFELNDDAFQMKLEKINSVKSQVKDLNESIESLRTLGIECNTEPFKCKAGIILDQSGMIRFILSITIGSNP